MPSDNRWRLEDLRDDFGIALRALRGSPGFTAAIILSLALAIGSSASAFSVVDAVRFRALPFADADRLVLISEAPVRNAAGVAACRGACSVAFTTYQQVLSKHSFKTLAAVAAHVSGGKALTANGESETIIGTLASDNLFAMLSVRPVLGRGFTVEDNQLGAAPVTILSYDCGRRDLARIRVCSAHRCS